MTSSYFSTPEDGLDPDLFEGETLKDVIRLDILSRVVAFLHHHQFHAVEAWLEVWLAGSGVSYQWSAARDPGDLDCLLGVHYESFREANPKFAGLGNRDIAMMLNEILWAELVPTTADYCGRWELTFYVNPDSTDIRNINPYAAYDVKHSQWTVHPDKAAGPPADNKEWLAEVARDNDTAQTIVARYSAALSNIQNATNPAHRANAEIYLGLALSQARDLYGQIHLGRHEAFSRTGEGYRGRGNYRWQYGKQVGTVTALKRLVEYADELRHNEDAKTYGIDLPDAETLTLRAMLWQD